MAGRKRMVKVEAVEAKGKSFTLRDVPPETWKRLRHLAIEREQSVQALLVEMINAMVDEGVTGTEV